MDFGKGGKKSCVSDDFGAGAKTGACTAPVHVNCHIYQEEKSHEITKKKLAVLCTAALLCTSLLPVHGAETLTGTGTGFGGEITVTLSLEDGNITAVEIEAPDETPSVGGAALEEIKGQILADGETMDGVAGATFTSDGVRAALKDALGLSSPAEKLPMTAGTYVGTADGMNDLVEVTLEVSEDAILSAAVTSQHETAGIGAPLYALISRKTSLK